MKDSQEATKCLFRLLSDPVNSHERFCTQFMGIWWNYYAPILGAAILSMQNVLDLRLLPTDPGVHERFTTQSTKKCNVPIRIYRYPRSILTWTLALVFPNSCAETLNSCRNSKFPILSIATRTENVTLNLDGLHILGLLIFGYGRWSMKVVVFCSYEEFCWKNVDLRVSIIHYPSVPLKSIYRQHEPPN
jgi:hypothetical protein